MNKIYLDNGATTYPKPEEVYRACDDAMRNLSFNPSRGSYELVNRTNRMLRKGRRKILSFFDSGIQKDLVFSYSGTDGLNMLIHGLIRNNMKIVIGPYEHNSVYRPLKAMEKEGLDLRIIKTDGNYGMDLEDLEKQCEDVNYGIFSYTSNVTGVSLPIMEIADIIHRKGGKIIVDGAQAAGHQPISIDKEGIDFLASSGHKGLMGPMGTGILILPKEVNISPFRLGGTGKDSENPEMPEDLPMRLEAGTGNIPGIAGLIAGVEWLEKYGLKKIQEKEIHFVNRCMEAFENHPNIEIYGLKNNSQILSLNIKGKDSKSIAEILDQAYDLALRGGLHCAPIAHENIGTMPYGTLRASFSVFTKEEELRKFIEAILSLA